MTFCLKMLTQENVKFEINVNKEGSLFDLKKKIEEHLQQNDLSAIPAQHQRLIYQGRLLTPFMYSIYVNHLCITSNSRGLSTSTQRQLEERR